MRCPNCGSQLQRVSLDPDTPPWLCQLCARGWWQAEVDNSSHWRQAERDFGDNTHAVQAMAESERQKQHDKKQKAAMN